MEPLGAMLDYIGRATLYALVFGPERVARQGVQGLDRGFHRLSNDGCLTA